MAITEYVTNQGDTWDAIAYKVYGSETRMPALIDANLQHRETSVFSAGVILVIPAVARAVSANLPPWKRGVRK